MVTDPAQKWLENAERGIAQGRPGYVLTSSRELKKLGKPDEAEAVLRKALEEFSGERFPRDKIKILTNLCSIVMGREPSEVLELIRHSGYKDAGLRLMEATALGRLGREPEAISLLEDEIKLNPELKYEPDVARKLTGLYLAKGMDQEAVDFLGPLVEEGHFKALQMKQILASAYIKTRKADKALALLHGQRDPLSRETIKRAEEVLDGGSPLLGGKTRVFIIHGHDRAPLSELQLLVHRIGAEPVTFDDLPKPGSPTVIELLEEHIPSFDAIIALLTPDDEGRERGGTTLELRARQNVLIEAGYGLISHRQKSLIIALGGVSIPTDIEGVHTVRGEKWSSEVGMQVGRRLAEMGLNVDPSKAV